MTILVFASGIAGRFVGDLLQITRDLLIGAKPRTGSPASEPNPGGDKTTQSSSPQAPAAVAKRDRPAQADPVARRSVA
jgi:hypothetical protein